MRIAVLASGRGSNLQAILDAIADGRLDARVVGVFSDRAKAPALERALKQRNEPQVICDGEALVGALVEGWGHVRAAANANDR